MHRPYQLGPTGSGQKGCRSAPGRFNRLALERTRPYVGSTAMRERAGCAQSSTSSSIASHEVRRCLRRRLTVLQNAELVTFRICQHHPRNIALPNVNTGRSQCDESLHLGGLIVRTKIDMEAILALLGFVDWQEQDPGKPIWLWLNLKDGWVVVDDYPFKGFAPPPTQRGRVTGADNHLFPHKAHGKTIAEALTAESPRSRLPAPFPPLVWSLTTKKSAFRRLFLVVADRLVVPLLGGQGRN